MNVEETKNGKETSNIKGEVIHDNDTKIGKLKVKPKVELKLEATVKSENLKELCKLPKVLNPVLKTEESANFVDAARGCSGDRSSPPENSNDKTIKQEQLD